MCVLNRLSEESGHGKRLQVSERRCSLDQASPDYEKMNSITRICPTPAGNATGH